VGRTIGSREEVPWEREPVIGDDNDNNNNSNNRALTLVVVVYNSAEDKGFCPHFLLVSDGLISHR
jgi:hypothetical protein